ncbi:aminodeoxychorismate lyase [Pseudidiomarina gelatinasegens]|uniref:Aminodeoxychorismate lyase n=1 Tax=Pseudidiomarina gelatinasegens TaxID=2487740 RepID=A0A443Z670_9GAMM|nr:aminodeoxychorismate lyase [Pseudidiomarina gelatinasegens]RWU12222.1 aminodeoxychorismate lyase [Pseudidiomarina gelatinasegens]
MWLNGQPLSSQSLDRGLQFGDGHFTTLVIRHHRIEYWPRHWQRLSIASERLAMAIPEQEQVLSLLEHIAAEHQHCVVKLIITRGVSQRGYGVAANQPINWYVTISDLPQWSTQGLSVAQAKLRLAQQPLLAGLKTLNRLEQVLLTQERDLLGVDDLLVCDSQLHIVEAISSNLFWYDGDNWRIPLLKTAGIAGIMQAEICAAVLLEAIPTEATYASVASAQQAFLCNTVLGPRPIAKIDERVLPKALLPEVVHQWYSNVLYNS